MVDNWRTLSDSDNDLWLHFHELAHIEIAHFSMVHNANCSKCYDNSSHGVCLYKARLLYLHTVLKHNNTGTNGFHKLVP